MQTQCADAVALVDSRAHSIPIAIAAAPAVEAAAPALPYSDAPEPVSAPLHHPDPPLILRI
jgi:hypothetical protein